MRLRIQVHEHRAAPGGCRHGKQRIVVFAKRGRHGIAHLELAGQFRRHVEPLEVRRARADSLRGCIPSRDTGSEGLCSCRRRRPAASRDAGRRCGRRGPRRRASHHDQRLAGDLRRQHIAGLADLAVVARRHPAPRPDSLPLQLEELRTAIGIRNQRNRRFDVLRRGALIRGFASVVHFIDPRFPVRTCGLPEWRVAASGSKGVADDVTRDHARPQRLAERIARTSRRKHRRSRHTGPPRAVRRSRCCGRAGSRFAATWLPGG